MQYDSRVHSDVSTQMQNLFLDLAIVGLTALPLTIRSNNNHLFCKKQSVICKNWPFAGY